MIRVILSILVSMVGAVSAKASYQFYWSLPSTPVANGRSYDVILSVHTPWTSEQVVTIYKNGSFFASSGLIWDNMYYVGRGTSDAGPQAVEYYAQVDEGWNGQVLWADMANDTQWVTISSNLPPTVNLETLSPQYLVQGTPVQISGWAYDPEHGAPVSQVDIVIGGNVVGVAALGGDRPDVASAHGRPDYRYSGFSHTISTSSLNPGSYYHATARARDAEGNYSYSSKSFRIKGNQVISFPNPGTQTEGESFSLSASSSSNLPISYSVLSGPATVNGSTINLTGPGTVTLRASEGGNDHWNPAQADISFLVVHSPQAPNVNFTTSATSIYVGQTVNFSSSATDVNGDISFHTFWWDQGNGSRWTSPQFTYDYAPNGEGWSNISNSNGTVANAANNTITANWTPVRPGTYRFHSNARDSRSVWGNGTEYTITVPNRPPSVSYAFLDANHNPLTPDVSGRVTIPINGNFYIRIQGSDPDGRLSRLYLRMTDPNGVNKHWQEISVSGATASHDFGPFSPSGIEGVWDTWVHSQDIDATGWGGAPDFNGNNYGWATAGTTDLNAYARPAPTATVTVDDRTPNGTVIWYDGFPAPKVTLRYKASDVDGNLAGIRPQIWAEWEEDDYDYDGYPYTYTASYFDNNSGNYIPQSGYSGEVVREVTLDRDTDWYFWTDAVDANGQLRSSGAWNAGYKLTVARHPNTAPTGVSITAGSLQAVPANAVKLGESITFASSANDLSPNMQHHMFSRRGPRLTDSFDGANWVSYWDDASNWGAWSNPGLASGAASSTISAAYTPPTPGYWQFHANAWDGQGAWGTGAVTPVIFVAPRPTVEIQAQIGSRVARGGETIRINASQTVTVISTAQSQGWLSEHNILGISNGTIFTPAGGQSPLTGLAGLTTSQRSITWSPPGVGSYILYAECFTGRAAGERVNGHGGYPGYFNDSDPETERIIVEVHSALDSDSDGMDDYTENQHGLNPFDAADALLDKDGDGLTNVAEANLARDPSVADIDFGAAKGGTMQGSWPAKDTSKTTLVGTTGGAVSVDRSGNANYEIPIFAPKGANGLEPAISLKYTSGGPNGLLGVGWSVTGFSMITRGASNKMLYPTDEVTDDADGDLNDRFFLDGNRLQVVSGTYGMNGSEYRTALETFARIILHKSGSISWFELWSKDGSRLYYGNTGDSIVGAGSGDHRAIWGWMLNRIEDSAGNYISIEYFNSNPYAGIARPKSIKYTGGNGYAPSNSIDFEYMSRPDPFWILVGEESERSSEYVLNKINISGSDASGNPKTLRSYHLTYEQSSYTKRSRLKSVQEEGLNGSRFPATVFSWSDDSYGFSLFGSYGLPHEHALLFAGDYNLDAKTDLLQVGLHRERYTQTFLSNGSNLYQVGGVAQLNTDSSFDQGNDNILVGDVTGDGRPDIVFMIYKQEASRRRRYIVQMDGNGGYNMANVTPGGAGEETVHLSNLGGSLINSERLIDMDGSGKLALFIAESNRNVNQKCGYFKFNPASNLFEWTNLGSGKIFAEDDVRLISSPSGLPRFQVANAPLYQWNSNYASYSATDRKTIITGRMDDEEIRIADAILLHGTPLPSSAGSDDNYVSNPDKRGTGRQVVESFPKTGNANTLFMDINGDGRDDEILMASGQNSKLKLATGQIVLDPIPHGPSWTEKVLPLDVNGDGRLDLLIRGDPSKGSTSRDYRILKADGTGPTADLITNITNGLGSTTEISYKPLSDNSVYQLGASTDAALIPLRPTFQVVSELKFDAGVAHTGTLGIPLSAGSNADYTITYAYEGLRSAPYRGLVGFSKIFATDSRTGIQTRTEFVQTSNLSQPALNGQIKSSSKWRGALLLSKTDYSHSHVNLNGGKTSYAYVSASTSRTYAYNTGQSSQGVLLNTSSAGQTNDEWGNVTSSVSSAGFDGRTTITDATYWPAITTSGTWVAPRLATVTTTFSKGTGEPTDVTNYREFYYRDNDDVAGNDSQGAPAYPTKIVSDAPTSEVEKRSETKITYGDTRGNATKISISGFKNASDLQTREVSYSYDSLTGRFPEIETRLAPDSAGGEIVQSAAYDQATGLIETSWDPNSLPTTFTYDDFGRPVSITGPDGITVRTDVEWTTSSRGVFAKKVTTTGVADNATVQVAPPSCAIFDRLGRLTKSATVDADGYPVWSETVFDSSGRVRAQSTASRQLPSSNVFWHQYGYDAIGRPNSVVTTSGVIVDVAYNNLTADYTYTGSYGAEAIVKKRRIIQDPAGRTISIQRNLGLGQTNERDAISYVYDEMGLVAEIDANGAKRIVHHDFRGFPTYIEEPDAGSSYSSYNAFGELYEIIDAKSQTTTINFDVLGRPIAKIAPEGTTTLVYDTAEGKGMGLLAAVTSPDSAGGSYVESYRYHDQIDRIASITTGITMPGGGESDTFSVSNTYDSHFRPQRVTYSVPGDISQDVGYRYNGLGVLREIRDLSHPNLSDGSILWGLVNVDDSGRVESEIFGNGLSSWTGYSAVDGTLRHRLVENRDGFVENIRMLTDTFGNFRERQLRAGDADGTVVQAESYTLDLLDRLTEVKLNGVSTQSMMYATNGNLTNKSGIGDYLYTSKHHAATSVGNVSLQYDDNGNLTHKAGVQVATWTSFNQPKTLTDSGGTSTFRYGASGNRVQHSLSSGESITYAGSVIEYVRKAGAAAPRFRIFGPSGQIAQITGGEGRRVMFFAGDHLGSIESVTTQGGDVSESVSFDPWGKRRNADWSAGAPPARIGDVNRGFTGHEMMEHVGLINMNGRVYDPGWGRFLSKDPVISIPSNAQTYNGYSYVANNPVSHIDPSGFQLIELYADSGYGNYDFSDLNVYSGGGGGSWISVSFSSGTSSFFGGGGPLYSVARYKSERFRASASLEFAPTGYMNLAFSSADSLGHSSLASIGYAGGEVYLHAPNNAAQIRATTGWDRFIGSDPIQGTLGFIHGAKDLATGLYSAVRHPINTAKHLGAQVVRYGPGAPIKGWIDMGDENRRLGAFGTGKSLFAVSTMFLPPARLTRGAAENAGGKLAPFMKCFPAGTLVLMADGSAKPIEDIKEGDEVMADDPGDNAPASARKVTHLLRNWTERLIHVAVDKDGDGKADGEIKATGEHPFWTSNRGWIAAKDLESGDVLQAADGAAPTVVSAESVPTTADTFNLTVDGTHTYFAFAGDIPLLVHNAEPISLFDVRPYADFAKFPGDGLVGHEMLQRSWLVNNDYGAFRGANPSLALETSFHINPVNRLQAGAGLWDAATTTGQSAYDNIRANIRVLENAGVPRDVIATQARAAKSFANSLPCP